MIDIFRENCYFIFKELYFSGRAYYEKNIAFKKPGWYNMDKEKSLSHITDEKEGKSMAVLAKPINRIAVIKKQDSQEFVREFNENKISKEFLNSCKKAGKLFGKRK